MSTISPARPSPPPPRPAHPITPAQLQWLRREVADWEREGLLAPRQGETLLARYQATRRAGLARLLLALGAVFVGFGLIWLVAANLDRLPPLGRFLAVVVLWVAATVGAELLAGRRAHGGPVPSPVVHAGRLLAALLLGAVVFQAAQSLQVPAYEPRLVGVWAAGALLHGYVVRAGAPLVLGVAAGLGWLVWSAVWDEPTVLGVLLTVCAGGVAAVSVASLHDRRGDAGEAHGPDLAAPWRVGGVVVLLGALFAAALPFVEADALTWTPRLVVVLAAAAALAATAVVVHLSPGADRRPVGEPLGAVAVSVLALLLVAWEAGDSVEQVAPSDWAHAVVAVAGYLAVCTAVAALGVLRERTTLTVVALVALVVFTTFQAFAVFAQIVDGAWLFLLVGLVLAGSGVLADRGRRRLAATLGSDGPGPSGTTRPTSEGDLR